MQYIRSAITWWYGSHEAFEALFVGLFVESFWAPRWTPGCPWPMLSSW